MLARCTTSAPAARRWRQVVLTLVTAILYLALSPAPPKAMDTGWDKANHALAFLPLASAGYFGWCDTTKRLVWLWLALLAFGGGIEIAPLFVPPRSAEWADWLADAVGIAIGTAIAAMLTRVGRD